MTSLLISPSGDSLYAGVGSEVYSFALSSAGLGASGGSKSFAVFSNGQNASQGDVQLQTFILSKCGSYLYGGYNDKTVICWDTSNGQVVAKSALKKKLNSMVITSFDGKDVLLVADKFGEVWAFDQKLEKSVMITGHSTSIITDMAILKSATGEKEFLVTSDRDEKIRISSLPNVNIIQSYCLGHTSVVSSIDIMSMEGKQYIVSCGWDHKLCIWDAMNNASLVLEHQLPNKTSDAVEGEGDCESKKEKEKSSDGDGDGEEEEEKNYDENKAGSYPIKVVPFTIDDFNYIAILFRGENAIHIFSVKSKSVFTLEAVSSYELAATPSDLMVLVAPGTNTTCLAVLLPRPHCLEFIELELSAEGLIEFTKSKHPYLSANIAERFREQCSNLPDTVDFKQKGVASSSDDSNNAQFKKHNLHAPYTTMGGDGARLQKGEGARAAKKRKAEAAKK